MKSELLFSAQVLFTIFVVLTGSTMSYYDQKTQLRNRIDIAIEVKKRGEECVMPI